MRAAAADVVVVALGDVIHTVGVIVIQIGQEGGINPLHTTRPAASCWLLVRNRTDTAAAAAAAASTAAA